uniref:Nischarin n=1 Tax=Oryzias latipes TaxID=8090 RepID=A0A3P9HE48_ORYLA
MDPPVFSDVVPERIVKVVGSELVENYTVYIIEMMVGQYRWTVKHRYSDFHELHEKLTAEKKVDRGLLPPKKILGKNSKSLVERRQKELELYLQALLQQFPEATPTPLASFLLFHLYEINGIATALAEELFHRGEQLLQAGEVFCLHPLQLYSISQQLRLAKPTCFNGDAKSDLGHILDFTCRLRYLKISGSRGSIGTSNIQETSLPFDLSVFKSLLQIEISDCSSQQIGGLPALRPSLVTMTVRRTTDFMTSILLPEASEFSQWEPEGLESACPVTAVIPVWRNLTTLDMSHNCISTIDSSVRVIPKVEFLDLSYNKLSSVENLQHLYNLVHVDLSFNNLRVLEAAHTRLGNIKTLNLAGNQLECLSGLSKLYSLVNLDLSHNQLAQLEEIRNISHLPCLEKLNLSSNPICIDPDYRTKVLALFGDRAAEVCLDCKATMERELDTVEVLKAIRKAKEVKDRMSSTDKKASEETQLSAAAPPPSSSLFTSAFPSPADTSSSHHTQKTAFSSQGNQVMSPEEAAVTALPPASLQSSEQLLSADTAQEQKSAVTESKPPLASASTAADRCDTLSSSPVQSHCSLCSSALCPLLPPYLFSLSSNQDFITQLSKHLRFALKEQETMEEGTEVERRSESSSGPVLLEKTDFGTSSQGSRDGYFEMGLDDSVEEPLSPSPTLLPAPGTEEPSSHQEEECEEIQVLRVLWCCCVRVEEELKHSVACLVLTSQRLGLLFLSHDNLWTNQDTDQSVEKVLSSLQMDFLVPFSQLLLSFSTGLPDSCISFGLQAGLTRWYIFSGPEELRQTRAQLSALLQAVESPSKLKNRIDPQLLPPSLVTSWEQEESQGAQGGYPVYLLSSFSSGDPDPPSLLFLTDEQLWVLKVDFTERAQREMSNMDLHQCSSSWCRLVRFPLGSVVLHPRQRDAGFQGQTQHPVCPQPQHVHRSGHSVELLLQGQRQLLLFPLTQDRSSFLEGLKQRKASLGGLQMLALPPLQPGKPCSLQGWSSNQGCSTSVATQQTLSSSDSAHLCVEENQPPPHLVAGLSPALKLLAGLRGQQLLSCFCRYIALSEAEELRQVMWLSVLLYKSPQTELPCCLLLSTNSIYFLLAESASLLGHGSVLDASDSGEPDAYLCGFLSVRLSELLAVNVGLFDQFFRIVGHSAGQVVSCLSRDSYGTGVFLQELMSVLSLQQQPPPTETSDQDFYSQFTDIGSGKMQNYELIHSSKVKFIYPSEEEMGDLTFIAAERKTLANTAALSSGSFDILLYLLVFQVQIPSKESAGASPSFSAPGPGPSPLLLPRTLILTSSDVFLLDEDYVSYPLPDFAKEPPSRERYRFCEARRIRDLDRVLLGYQTYPQALTLVFDNLPDLLCHLTMDHFAMSGKEAPLILGNKSPESEVQWCIFVPGANSRERLISVLARQWEALCSRELPVELTG